MTFWIDGQPSVSDGVEATWGGPISEIGTGALPGGGRGFSFNHEEADAVLQQFRDIRDELEETRAQAEELTQMRPPAEDPASVKFNNAAVEAFTAGLEFVDQEIQTYRELVARLEKALGAYQQADQSAAGQVGDAGGSDAETKGYVE